MKKFAIVAALTALSVSSAALAADESAEVKSKIDYKKNGGYESTITSEKKGPDGTVMKSTTDVDVSVDSKGRVSEEIDSKSTMDPEGLGNKKESITKVESKEKAGGGYEETKIQKNTDAAGTNVTTKVEKEVEHKRDGTVVETTEVKKTVDPKGLMNKETTTIKTKKVDGVVTERTEKH